MNMISSHTYIQPQDNPQSVWTISHGLGCTPVVGVKVFISDVLTGILPNSITYPDVGTVIVTFTTPRSGEARLS